MIERILDFSIRWRVLMLVVAAAIVAAGVYAAFRLPIDAVPDITSNQVQINTVAPAFAPLEMERYVTFPIEVAMSSVPRKEEIRSISQFGLSQVTVTFADDVDIYWARQLVLERLLEAERELPPGVSPELAPVSTGLGEIYQFTVERADAVQRRMTSPSAEAVETPTHFRVDWRRADRSPDDSRLVHQAAAPHGSGRHRSQQLRRPGEAVRSASRPAPACGATGLTLRHVIEALETNNSNAGGAYFERGGEQQIVRGVGLIQIASGHRGHRRRRARRHARVRPRRRTRAARRRRSGRARRHGTARRNGHRRRDAAQRREQPNGDRSGVASALEAVQKTLPRGIVIKPFYDRTDLVNKTIRTAATNLIEGGLLVIGVLFLFLLQLRAGLIVVGRDSAVDARRDHR